MYYLCRIVILSIKTMKKATIEYDFQENPCNTINKKGSRYHVRIHNNQIITLNEICERIQKSSTVSNADFHAVIVGLEEVIADELAQGNVVSFGDICRFEPILTTEDTCNGSEKGNAIQLKTVRIRPLKPLVEQVSAKLRPCARVHAKRSPKMTTEELGSWLAEYFKTNPFVRRVVLEKELGFTHSLANKYLHQLVKDGVLLHPGAINDPLYYPAPKEGVSKETPQ